MTRNKARAILPDMMSKKEKKVKEKYVMPHYDYPNKYDEHMITVKEKVKLPTLDENYPYIQTSRWARFKQWLFYHVTFPIAWVACKVRTGFKVKGREILKKYKELLKNGAITICNHMHRWDFILILLSIRPVRPKPIIWPINLMGADRKMVRRVGGIPIPESYAGMKTFNAQIDDYMNKGNWLHVYPETAMWHYYDKIRPFKKGAFTYGVKHKKPIVPLVVNYRARSWFMRIFTKKPAMTVNILDPIMPSMTLNSGQAKMDLLTRCRTAMQKVAGFKEKISQEEKYRDKSIEKI